MLGAAATVVATVAVTVAASDDKDRLVGGADRVGSEGSFVFGSRGRGSSLARLGGAWRLGRGVYIARQALVA